MRCRYSTVPRSFSATPNSSAGRGDVATAGAPYDWPATRPGVSGDAWYLGPRFELPARPEGPQAVMAKRLGGAGAIYINGKQVGQNKFRSTGSGRAGAACLRRRAVEGGNQRAVHPPARRAGRTRLASGHPHRRQAGGNAGLRKGALPPYDAHANGGRVLATISIGTLLIWWWRRKEEVFGYFGVAAMTARCWSSPTSSAIWISRHSLLPVRSSGSAPSRSARRAVD